LTTVGVEPTLKITARLKEAVRRRRPKIGVLVAASLFMACGGQVAPAQVDWQWGPLVVTYGLPGTWNDEGHRLGSVVFDGSLHHLYLIGGDLWGGAMMVGHRSSSDVAGPWDADSENPVLEPGDLGQWDEFRIYTLSVDFDGSTFHMWYGAHGELPGDPGPSYVGHATNDNGFGAWSKDHQNNPLPGLEPGQPGEWDEYGVAPKTVLVDGMRHRMWFTTGFTTGGGETVWHIGLAESTDSGITWAKDPENPVFEPTELWETTQIYSPAVLPDQDTGLGVWYGGISGAPRATIGYAISPDGIHWGKWPGNPVLEPDPWCNRVDTSAMLREGGTVYGWVAMCEYIYLVSSPFEVGFFDGFESGDTSAWSAVVPSF
jgi:hypothetical protein